jgi:hypothetical protein
MSTHALGQGHDSTMGMWEKEGQVYLASILADKPDPMQSAVAASGSTGNRKHPAFALGKTKKDPSLIAWTEGTGWEKGGALAWECLDSTGAQIASGRVEGVPVWSFAAAVPEPDGSFSLIY